MENILWKSKRDIQKFLVYMGRHLIEYKCKGYGRKCMNLYRGKEIF